MTQSFKLMSYNIQCGKDRFGTPNLWQTIQTISAEAPDIVALQEVDKYRGIRSLYANQLRAISESLGMQPVFGANLDYEPPAPDEPRRQYGTAIMSKYNIVASRNYHLSSFGKEQRGLLEAEIDRNGERLYVYCLHMGLTEEQRIVQAEEALAVIKRRSGPVILAGDFNASPDSPEVQRLLEGGFFDSFAGTANDFTFPSDEPKRRIDYILYNSRLERRCESVIVSTASDHLPITAEFSL